ncbi:Flp pilus assembly protein CpaB [Paraburkholderia sp. PREW-6R]|uniref:Flp pilus assembly protein CpaB n=1 Tax=Paraburkholderia sp. PREW-6R TaxID=3141544 RepID=UPI0031F5478B
MSNTFKLLLLVVAAGIFAVLARTLFLNASSNTPAPVESSKMIRVAGADLPEGLLLRDSDFGWRSVENGDVPSGAIVKGAEGTELKGALLRHPITKGTVIVSADVIPANDPGFLAATLKPDMRAVSVAIDDVSGNAGLIQPGDYVDLLMTQQLDRQDASRDMSITSETVAQRVRVLAVGSQFQRPKGNTSDVDSHGTARTVTLEVTPHRAEVIAVAAKLGSLSLALRSFARTAVVNAASDAIEDAPPPVYAGDITHAARVQRASAPATQPEAVRAVPVDAPVQVFRGSDKSAVGSESGGAWSSGTPPLPPIPSGMALPGAVKQTPSGQPAKSNSGNGGNGGGIKPIAQQFVDGVPVAQ